RERVPAPGGVLAQVEAGLERVEPREAGIVGRLGQLEVGAPVDGELPHPVGGKTPDLLTRLDLEVAGVAHRSALLRPPRVDEALAGIEGTGVVHGTLEEGDAPR